MVTSLLPQMTGTLLPPAVPQTGVSADEQRLISELSTKLAFLAWPMWTCQQYYDAEQRLANLGLSVPDQLASIRTVVDWPRIVVDPLVERAVVDGFRLPGASDTDSELWEFWQANDLDSEFPLVIQDALTLRCGYMIVGRGDADGDPPLITAESPFNLAANWDPRSKKVTGAYQSYQAEGVYRATLYQPNVTVFMSRAWDNPTWVVDERDEHNFGEVPVVRFPNRARTADREGRSEITPAIRNTTDAAVRTLLGMEVAREFYSVPHRYVLGATEADFIKPDGTPKSAIDMVMTKFVAFQRNARGDLPQVGQFTAFDPSVYTKIIDKYAMLMSSFTGYPPEYFGETPPSNPASADAIRSAQDRLNRRGERLQNAQSVPAQQVMCLSWRFAHDGAELPRSFKRMETDWQPVATPTPAATADAMAKQVQIGSIPATSDVTLKRLGYSALERGRLAQDRAKDAAAQLEAEVAQSLLVAEARKNKAVVADLQAEGAPAPEQTPPPGS